MLYLVGIIIIVVMFAMRHSSNTSLKSSIKQLMRQAARYATAAQQDAAPLMAVLHANYAAAYMYAMLDIATDSQIHNMTGVDMKKFREHVTNVQDMVTKKTVDKCPEFAGEIDLYLSTIAGEA